VIVATEERELHVVFGSGPVGRAVAAELVRGDRRVRVVNRTGRDPGPDGVKVVRGDASDPAFARAAAAEAKVVYQALNPGYRNCRRSSRLCRPACSRRRRPPAPGSSPWRTSTCTDRREAGR
jgi:hypothetical protein